MLQTRENQSPRTKRQTQQRRSQDTGFVNPSGNGTQLPAQHPGGAFDRTGGNVGTSLLTPYKASRFKVRRSELLKGTKKDNLASIYRAAQNMAKCYGFKLQTQNPRKPEDLKVLVNELESKTMERIDLRKDDEGSLHLFHMKCLMEECEIYTIPYAPTFSMRKEAGEITRRFLETFRKHFEIPFINDTTRYEMERNYLEDRLYDLEEEIKAGHVTKEDLENEKQEAQDIENYWSGEMCRVIADLKATPSCTEDDIRKFKPRGDKEKNLKGIMLEGWKYINSGLDIWEYCARQNEELEKEQSDVYIFADDIMMAIYDEDELLDRLIESINNDANCGCGQECFAVYEEIKEKGDVTIKEELTTFFEYLNRLYRALYSATQSK